MKHQPLPEVGEYRVRSADRGEVVVPCTVVKLDGVECAGEVRNLSPGGALLACSEPLLADSFISLRFNDWEPISAQVKWVDGEQSGCRFVRSLTVRQYLRLRQGDAYDSPVEEKPTMLARLRQLLPGKAA